MIKGLYAAGACALLLTGCGVQQGADGVNITASFYPVYSIAQEVARGAVGVSVTSMAQNAVGCLHDYSLTTGDMSMLSSADLFIINGAGMESFEEDIVNTFPELELVDTSIGCRLLEESEVHGEHNEHGHEEHGGHTHGEKNAHIWLSPANAAIQAENIAEALSVADTANAALYHENLDRFRSELLALEEEYIALRELCGGMKCVSFHEGFDYIADESGIEVSLGIYTDSEYTPSAGELVHAIEDIRSMDIDVIFAAEDEGLKFARLVSGETGTPVYILNPVTGGEAGYIEAARNNLKVLKEAAEGFERAQ